MVIEHIYSGKKWIEMTHSFFCANKLLFHIYLHVLEAELYILSIALNTGNNNLWLVSYETPNHAFSLVN